MMDFTLIAYQRLLSALKRGGYSFFTFQEFCEGKAKGRFVILRHDVDSKAENSVATAKIENEMSIVGSYFFRIVPQSNKPYVLKEIVLLGHEIGYHYEDLSLFDGDAEKAIQHFEKKLNYFRQFYPVKTICIHGSPIGNIDNREIWQKYNYKDFGIIGEPYFDVDFNKVLYLTDTGRSWDGGRYSIRDKVKSNYDFHLKSTKDIIKAIKAKQLPEQIMLTVHPQRWTDNKVEWLGEYLVQWAKNRVKYLIIKMKKPSPNN